MSSLSLKDALIKSEKVSGIALANQFVENIQDNYVALTTINEMLDNKIYDTAKTVIFDREELSNHRLIQIANNLGVEELNWINSTGYVVYSSVGYHNYQLDDDHPFQLPWLKVAKNFN